MDTLKVKGGPRKIEALLKHAGYEHQPEDSQQTLYTRWSLPPTNYIGTSLFLGYIVAALAFTILLLGKNIVPLWSRVGSKSKNTRILAYSTAGSFTVLSITMINVLYQSVLLYLDTTGTPFSLERLWYWMLETTLFRNFAENLMNNEHVAYWTMTGLAANALMALQMQSLGCQHHIRRLWAYFLVAQILPSSFAWLLIRLEVALKQQAGRASKPMGTTKVQRPAIDVQNGDIVRWTFSYIYIIGFVLTTWILLTASTSSSQPKINLAFSILPIRLLLALPLCLPHLPFSQWQILIIPALSLYYLVGHAQIAEAWSGPNAIWRIENTSRQNPAIWVLICDMLFWGACQTFLRENDEAYEHKRNHSKAQ